MTETDLIRQARSGDPEAWEALTKTHQEAVFRLAYLLLGDPDDAEDVAQEAFVRAFYALRRFDSARPLRPWLMQIASNLASNRRRSLGRYFNALLRLAREPSGPDAPLPEDDSQLLREAVQKIKFEFQQVVYLRYFLDMSEDEMSMALGIPEGTVKSRLHRALAALRKVISDDYPHLRETFSE